MAEIIDTLPVDALGDQDLGTVNGGLSVSGLVGTIIGIATGIVPGAPNILSSVTESGLTPASLGGVGNSPLSLQGGCPVLLSSKTE